MTDEEIRALVDEFNRKVSLDPEIRAVMEKIRNQEADLDDTSRLCLRRSELMGQFMQDQLPELAPGDRERLCTALLRNGYDVTNEVVPDALRAQDERLGLHLNPVRAPFPWERVQKVSHSLEDPGITEEQRNRRAGAPVANTGMSFHDDSVKENAKIRAKLGFKCYLNRVAAAGCCKWCTDIAGRYVYGDQPEDVFRRHDNCGCTVTFENGRERQDVWSKRTWNVPDPKIIQRYALERLTLAGSRDIMNEREFGVQYGDKAVNADMDYIYSNEFASKFNSISSNQAVNNALLECAKEAIKHRNGSKFEDMFFIHGETGEILARQTQMTQPSGIVYNDEIKELLRESKEKNIPLVTLHNHPEGYPPSVDDLNKSYDNNTLFGIAVGHNGQVYKYDNPGKRTEEASLIHENIAILCMGGADPDRIYQEEFSIYGLRYEIMREGE